MSNRSIVQSPGPLAAAIAPSEPPFQTTTKRGAERGEVGVIHYMMLLPQRLVEQLKYPSLSFSFVPTQCGLISKKVQFADIALNAVCLDVYCLYSTFFEFFDEKEEEKIRV